MKKQTKKLTVSIGIPAYNEEANIKYLLKSLLAQKQNDFILKEIIVYSDGSTDRTADLAQSVQSRFIKIHNDQKRMGKITRQNEILKLFKGDILVLLDADVLPANKIFLNSLVKPIIKNQGDLVSGKVISLRPTSLIEYVINTSVDFKCDFLERAEDKKFVYLCFGRVRAFSKKLTQNLVWPETIAEDAYSYFHCISNNLRFFYNPEAKVFFRSPISLKDHIKQSVRFVQSKKLMKYYFNEELVDESYDLDKLLTFRTFISYLIKKPLALIAYLLIYLSVNILSKSRIYTNSTIKWSVSTTTKKLI